MRILGCRRGAVAGVFAVWAMVGLAAPAFAAPGDQVWLKRYNGSSNGNDQASAVAVSPDGTKVFVTGDSFGGSTAGADYLTVAYNALTGAVLWSKRYNGPNPIGGDIPTAIAVSPDGAKVFVTGYSHGGSSTVKDYATVAYNAQTGAQLWVKRHNGPESYDDIAKAIVVSPDSTTVFVSGFSDVGFNPDLSVFDADFGTIAYNAQSGAVLWLKYYGGIAHGVDDGRAIAVSPDATTVFVTGISYTGSTTGYDYATVAYVAGSGALMWTKRYNGPSNGYDTARAIAVSPDGLTVVATGESAGAGTDADYATVAYNSLTGAQRWVKRYNGPASSTDIARAIVVSPDSSTVFVTGESTGSSTRSDYATLAYAALSGTPVWTRRYNGTASSYDVSYAIAVSADSATVFVTGESDGTGTGSDVLTTAYDAQLGTRLWLKRYDGPSDNFDGGRAIVMSPNGTEVFVVGFADARALGKGLDYVTIAYTAQ